MKAAKCDSENSCGVKTALHDQSPARWVAKKGRIVTKAGKHGNNSKQAHDQSPARWVAKKGRIVTKAGKHGNNSKQVHDQSPARWVAKKGRIVTKAGKHGNNSKQEIQTRRAANDLYIINISK